MINIPDSCAWCDNIISEFSEHFALKVKMRPGFDIAQLQGTVQMVELKKTKKIIPVIFVTEDSDAKKEGYDMLFMLCSEKCSKRLKNALENENKYNVN
jgi:hypothetical protein